MSSSIVTSTPNTISVNLGNGITSTTTYKYNSENMPISLEYDQYQNGVLTSETSQTYTYNNGVETINWFSENKTFNTSTSGSYTVNY